MEIEKAKIVEFNASEKLLSKNIFERGVDEVGFARIRSKGDESLFRGNNTKKMKEKYGVKENRSLADFLPTLTIAAKSFATEMTNYNVTEQDMDGEEQITEEHVENNKSIRNMLVERGIKPENLKPVYTENKKIPVANKLPESN